MGWFLYHNSIVDRELNYSTSLSKTCSFSNRFILMGNRDKRPKCICIFSKWDRPERLTKRSLSFTLLLGRVSRDYWLLNKIAFEYYHLSWSVSTVLKNNRSHYFFIILTRFLIVHVDYTFLTDICAYDIIMTSCCWSLNCMNWPCVDCSSIKVDTSKQRDVPTSLGNLSQIQQYRGPIP